VVLITTVPSTVFFGWSHWWMPVVSVGGAVLAVALLRAVWRCQLRHFVGFQN
jgi:hypothetical protein